MDGALDISTLTAKEQVTVPKTFRAIAPLDLAYLRSLDASLHEWSSPADEDAFSGL